MSKKDDLTEREFLYHIEEYKLLKSELTDNFRSANNAATISFSANAAIISYFVTAVGDNSFSDLAAVIASVIPLGICLIALAFYALRRRSINKIVEYLLVIEADFSASNLGWEKFYAIDVKRRPKLVRTPIVIGAIFLLQILIILLFIGFVFATHPADA